MRDFLSLDDKKLNSWNITLLFILISYIWSVGVRFIYIGVVDKIKFFYWHGQLMINNPDGYYYAQGARDILEKKVGYLSPVHTLISELTAFFASFLHLPLDTVILYIPGFLGSLVVIPVILIGRSLGSSFVGFLAALLSGIAWSYYHRTMFGYYDTDMLTVVLPTFAIWAVIWSLKNKNVKYFFLAPLIEIFMLQWHDGLYNVANGIFIMSFLYVLYLKFIKKEDVLRENLFLLFLIVPLIPVSYFLRYISLFVLYGIVFLSKEKVKNLNIKYFIWIILGIYVVLIGLPWINMILHTGYFNRAKEIEISDIHYFSVVNTVREAGHIDYNVLVHRISGSWIGLIVGVIGYILLAIRYPVILVSLPMVVLGFFAVRGGLRFTIFAVPFMALGDAYIVYLIGKLAGKLFINDKVANIFKYTVSFILMGAFIYPNYKHIHVYIMPTVFNKNEVEVLNKLKHIAKRNDFVMTWWDYGYPIRYYADVKTFVDGGRHSGNVDFPVSFALTRPQLPSKNMAVLDTYYTDLTDKTHQKFDIVKYIMKKYHLKSIDEVEPFLYHKIPLPKVKEDIYYYLPLRMFNIFPTVALFSSLDLKTGKVINHFYLQSNGFKIASKNILMLNDGIAIDLKNKVIILGKEVVPIKNLAITAYNDKGKLIKQISKINSEGLDVIIMQSYRKVLIVDDFFYNSTFFQLFVFQNTQGLFKPVIITPFVKVYKLVK